ncbi:MAG: hypothetical protein RDV48_26025 [Candidatus Eremiobacteraeota bacterium]|nr:hypothetical protein [Candidatus Eremiobacteraeota bacterium]
MIKVCATCRHLKVLDQGREFEYIIDTEYTLFECEVYRTRTKEYYLMAPVPESIDEKPVTCEYWEEWKKET